MATTHQLPQTRRRFMRRPWHSENAGVMMCPLGAEVDIESCLSCPQRIESRTEDGVFWVRCRNVTWTKRPAPMF